MLKTSARPLCEAYDLAMLDLDGVVYIGGRAVPQAGAALAAVRRTTMHLAFITNNASRTPEAVARHLRDLGITAQATDVVTSAQAAAHLLAGRLAAGARVFLLGGEGLESALVSEGLVPVTELDEQPVAVVTGYGPDVPWKRIMQGAVLIREGLPWVASNTDLTIPTAYGFGPGHGVQVRMLAEFAGVQPIVAGKPARALLDETVRRVGGMRPLMIGDRLDTDIEGAANAGVDSLCVLTGVTGLHELVAAAGPHRPSYIGGDLRALLTAHTAPVIEVGRAHAGGWTGEVVEGRLQVRGRGSTDDWWRAAAVAAWAHADRAGQAPDVHALAPPPEGGS